MLLEFRISLLLPPPIKFRSDTKCKENAQYPGNVYNIAQLLPNFKNALNRLLRKQCFRSQRSKFAAVVIRANPVQLDYVQSRYIVETRVDIV